MNIETVLTCPLGHKCQEIKDDKVHKCAWFIELKGQNPQNGDELNEHACAITWMPILQLEVARTNRGQTAAIESFRNETVQQAQMSNTILSSAIYNQMLPNN
jgi:hypothetical protein